MEPRLLILAVAVGLTMTAITSPAQDYAQPDLAQYHGFKNGESVVFGDGKGELRPNGNPLYYDTHGNLSQIRS
jgi:hypothetical protein